MQNIVQTATEYWPYLLGLFFLAITAINARSWYKDRQTEG